MLCYKFVSIQNSQAASGRSDTVVSKRPESVPFLHGGFYPDIKTIQQGKSLQCVLDSGFGEFHTHLLWVDYALGIHV